MTQRHRFSARRAAAGHDPGGPARRNRNRWRRKRVTRVVAAVTASLMPLTLATQALTATSSSAAVAAAVRPVGNGFVVTPGDLAFILKQIKIAERHSTTYTPAKPCSTLLNQVGDGIPDAEQVPDILTSYGLRTVDGSCNNLKAGDQNFAAADQVFPRLTKPLFRDAEPIGGPFLAPGQTAGGSSYTQKTGNVVDSGPRTVSNLIVAQTSTNPAAVAAAGHPVRTQDPTASSFPCDTDPVVDAATNTITTPGVPAGCTPKHKTLFIPNVTTDVGLSPPYNSWFTFFGQFFDHGVDQTVKSGSTVFVPLRQDDPLRTLGPDGDPATPDQVTDQTAFMVLTRAKNQPGPDGVLGDRSPTNAGPPVVCTALNVPAGCDESADDIQDATNTDSPLVDQSQTYTSHPSHQAFLREYDSLPGGRDGVLGDRPPTNAGPLVTCTSLNVPAG